MKYLKIYEDCRFVKGAIRSVIYDLGKENYYYIPNQLYEIAHKFDKAPIEEIFKYYGAENEQYVSEYISYLLENKFAFLCSKKQTKLFSKLSLKWDYPHDIASAIIEYNHQVDYQITFNQLEQLSCHFVEFRVTEISSIKDIDNTLQLSNNTSVKSISLIAKFTNDISDYIRILNQYKRVNLIILHSASENNIIVNEDLNYGKLISIKTDLSVLENYKLIDSSLFRVNLPFFTESLDYNSYFNRKIIIDFNGNIKTDIYSAEGYGNIDTSSIKDIVKSTSFQKFWNISKDKIEVCKDCEYRYMCIDSRAPIKKESGQYSLSGECGYNPYIAKWEGQDEYVAFEEWREQNPDWE